MRTGYLFSAFLLLLFFMTTGSARADEPFRWEETDADTVALYEGKLPVWNYVWRQKTHDWVPESDMRRISGCYFHPLFGFAGEKLTINATVEDNHAHHHGVWCSFMTILVHRPTGEPQSFDTWTDNGPLKREFVAWGEKKAGPKEFTFEVENGWFIDGKEKIMEERVKTGTHATEVHPLLGRLRAIDLSFSFKAVGYPITLASDRKLQKNFSCLAVRFVAPKEKSVVQSSEGVLVKDSLKIPLPWLDYQCKFDEKGETMGVAFFPAKTNPVHKSGWAVRHYGMVVTGWPGVEGTTLKPGDKPVTLQYRLLLHEKPLTVEQLNVLCREYQK